MYIYKQTFKKPAQLPFHSKRPHIISKMNNKKEKKKQNQTNKHEQSTLKTRVFGNIMAAWCDIVCRKVL
jgi:hypothetical protein